MADRDALIEEIYEYDRKAKEYAQRASELKAELRSQVQAGKEYAVGNLIAKVTTNRRFNPKKAALLLSDEEREQVSVTTVDARKFRALYPELVDEVSDHHDVKIAITEAD